MDTEFKELIMKRCQTAVEENDFYMKLEHDDKTDCVELQSEAEFICYQKGFSDALKILQFGFKM